jgi:quinolinate synthase
MELPSDYLSLSDGEIDSRIRKSIELLRDTIVILGHHYMPAEVVRYADHRGDSLDLSRRAAEARDARYIIFCGVDFMAETAAMLCSADQKVILPAGSAPCPMARMVTAGEAQFAWDELTGLWGGDVVPITYQNSTAAVKAFCGRHGGAVCTSSNAQALMYWGFEKKGHILFMPDENLGINSALALGIARSEITVWDPESPPDDVGALADAKVIVWRGYCGVHTRFTVGHVAGVRSRHPGITVVVHPECRPEVVSQADLNGSTAFIVRIVEQAPVGAKFAIGTEVNLVRRLAVEHPGMTIVPLHDSLCAAMSKNTPLNLLYVLEKLAQGEVVNVVTVDPETSRWANLALEEMLRAK